MILFDAHNHAHFDVVAAAGEESLSAALAGVGLEAAVVNGTCESDWGAVARLAERRDWAWPSYGLHPWHVGDRSDSWLPALESILDERGAVAIGEIGLDRARAKLAEDRREQEEVFLAQLEVARRRGLPVTIHCVGACGRVRELIASEGGPAPGFLLHAYACSVEMIPRFADLGGHFSFSAAVLDDRNVRARRALAAVPGDRLLLETDAPNMRPPQDRVRFVLPDRAANHPANIIAVYEGVASLRGEEPAALAAQVAANFLRLFGHGPVRAKPRTA